MLVSTKHGFSLEVNTNSYCGSVLQATGTYDEPESQLILSLVRPDDICIDAGAHVGYYACLMASAGANVIAFEPNPMHVDTLRENIRKFNGHAIGLALALSDQDGVADFHLPSEFDDGLGSLYWQQVGKMVSVRTSRLDSALKPGTKIRILKLDVEGAELPVLRGLGDRLSEVDYILIECASSNKDVPAINQLLNGWKVRRYPQGITGGIRKNEWEEVFQAEPDGNYLFINPKVQDEA